MNNQDGVISISEFIEQNFPGGELIEVQAPDGRIYTCEELKAIEWREKQMRIGNESEGKLPKDLEAALQSLSGKIQKKPRTLKKIFKLDNQMILLCNDDTLWIQDGSAWRAIGDAALPEIPQEV